MPCFLEPEITIFGQEDNRIIGNKVVQIPQHTCNESENHPQLPEVFFCVLDYINVLFNAANLGILPLESLGIDLLFWSRPQVVIRGTAVFGIFHTGPICQPWSLAIGLDSNIPLDN